MAAQEMVSSSNWKCGFRNATARYAPGFPGTYATTIRIQLAVPPERLLAFTSGLKHRSFPTTYCKIQVFSEIFGIGLET